MVIFLMPAQPIGLMADAPLLSGSEFALSACPLTLAKAAASSGSSSASSTSAQADRKEPFTYQEAVGKLSALILTLEAEHHPGSRLLHTVPRRRHCVIKCACILTGRIYKGKQEHMPQILLSKGLTGQGRCSKLSHPVDLDFIHGGYRARFPIVIHPRLVHPALVLSVLYGECPGLDGLLHFLQAGRLFAAGSQGEG